MTNNKSNKSDIVHLITNNKSKKEDIVYYDSISVINVLYVYMYCIVVLCMFVFMYIIVGHLYGLHVSGIGFTYIL